MFLDRLTHRAHLALLDMPKRDSVLGATVLKHLENSGGMGSHLIKLIPRIKVAKSKKVQIPLLIKEAYYQSIKLEHPYVGTEHLLLALLKLSGSKDFGKVKLELVKLSIFPYPSKYFGNTKDFPILDTFSVDLNVEALSEVERPLVYREVYDAFLESLLLKTTSNVLIVGDSGVGKSTLIKLLVRDIAYLEVPPTLAGYHVLDFDIVAFITGLFNKSSGVESSLSQLLSELKKLDRVILHIKNFQDLFSSTSVGSTIPVFYSLFLSVLENAGATMVATVNTDVYDRIASDNSSFFEKFSVIEIQEPVERVSKEILKTVANSLSDQYNISISKKVINRVYEKAKEAKNGVKLPKKAISLLDQCCAHVLLSKGKIPKSYKNLVDKSISVLGEMEDLVSSGKYDEAAMLSTKIKNIDSKLSIEEKTIFENPVKVVLTVKDVDEVFDDILDKKPSTSKVDIKALSSLGERVRKNLIGQDEAVDVVTKSLIRAGMGLRSKTRPSGNFMFLGPTGVGKTELAKVLSKEYFGENSLIRLDMSDFGEKHTVARLVGAPPGYVGYGEGGELTSKISANPDSLVLFDEIEKAHPDVLNILLQIMEEGELTDAKGQTFNFSQSIIILTSNLGTEILHNKGIGFEGSDVSDSEMEARLKENAKRILKPELLNRFDEIIAFKRLKAKEQLRVLELLIIEVRESLREQKITLTVQKPVKKHLLKKGYSKEYGARALRRVMEKELLDSIAEYLLHNTKRPLKLVASLGKSKIKITQQR